MKPTNTEESIYCAFAPGKQEWKAAGNYFTAEELKQMESDNDLLLFVPADDVVCAD